MDLFKVKSLLVLTTALSVVQAAVHLEQPEHVCVSGCNLWSGYISWNLSVDALLADYYTAECLNNVKLQSVYWCAQTYCTASDIYAGLDFLNVTCIEEAGIPLPRFETLAASRQELAASPVLSETDYDAGDVLSTPAIPDADWYEVASRTVRAYDRNFWYSYDFTWASYGFWGLVFTISMINRLINLIKTYRARPSTQRSHSRGVWSWIRRQLVVPATFGRHCQEPIRWATLPPRLESIIIFSYLLMSVIMCFPGYDLFDENLYWPTTNAQLARYIADRTAVLSIANVPILWLFAARNDPLLWLTGFSYASFNRFHRWVARLSFAFALVHSIVWTYDYIAFYGVELYYAAYEEVWWWTGVVATIIMALLLPASVYWLRNKHYDFFLIIHILLSVVFLVTLYFHIQVYEHFFDGFIWPCVAIWSLDRLLRILRVVYSSIIPRITKGTKAVATYDTRSEIIRLDVTDYFSKSASIVPGLYYYVYVPTSLKGWESHPFTLCSWQQSSLASPNSPTSPVGSLDIDDAEKTPALRTRQLLGGSESLKQSFLIRPYTGFTRRFRDKIATSQEGSCEVTVFLEGPYGRKMDLSNYSDVLIIAAGSGVVTAISHAHFLLSKNRTEVHLTWVVPQRRLVEDLCENELAALVDDPRLHMTVYLTSKAQVDTEMNTVLKSVNFRHGRPDIFTVMQEARASCKIDLAIVNSGTPQVADVCRASMVRLLKEDGPKVDYRAEDTPW